MRKIILLSFAFLLTYCTCTAQNPKDSSSSTIEPEALIDKKLELLRSDSDISDLEKENALRALKSESEKIGYHWGVLKSGRRIMEIYERQNKDKEIIELATVLKKIPVDERASRTLSNIYRVNAISLGYLGFDEASLKDFKTAIAYAGEIEDPGIKNFTLSLCYQGMTLYYFNKRLENESYRDSIFYYLGKSLEAINLVKDGHGEISTDLKYNHMAFNHVRHAINYLELADKPGNIQLAEKSLTQALDIVEKYNLVNSNKVVLLNQMSWLYLEKKDYEKTIEYAKLAWDLEKQFPDPDNRVESFEFLASAYSEMGDSEKSSLYMNKYSYLKDSIRITEKHNADQTFDILLSTSQKKSKKEALRKIIAVFGISLILLLGVVLYWKRKNRLVRKLAHKKYKDLIAKINHEKEQRNSISTSGINHKTVSQPTYITDETTQALLLKLEKFEASDKYLRADISQAWLANHLKTNTRYLSEIIKTHKRKNFNDYINGLRINHIIHKLVDVPLYREYKISGLAEECGYASRQVFVICFKKETGFTPSYFIENLRKEENM